MREKSIALSPKHGVNPTLALCFWCRRQTGELALLGRLPGDAEAPRMTVLDYNPCPQCKEDFAVGILIIEVAEGPISPTQPSLGGFYPTGRWSVVREEALPHMVTEEYAEQLRRDRRGAVGREGYRRLFGEDGNG